LFCLVTVTTKAREVTVTGPRGTLHRSFKHLAVDIQMTEIDGGNKLKVDLWFGNRETIASVRLVLFPKSKSQR
jgi:large subunit ribosomal protein L9e